MTTTIEQVRIDMQDCCRLLRSVNHELAWSIPVGWVKDSSQGERVKGAGTADPTGEVVVSTWHRTARGRVTEAAKAVARARTELLRAEVLLQSNTGGKPGLPEDGEPNWMCVGRRVGKHEYEEAVAAQERRHQRGEVAA